ncbi:MAG: CARDB domain-containing protein [Thermodesulfobacteriota bacterium]
MKKVLFLVLLIMVLTMEGVAFSAEQKSKLFVYNSSYDLTRGDLWEYIKDQQILLDMESYPKSFVVIGLGNTNESYSIGEMMATGTVGLSRFFWIDPKYPNKGVEIWDREFPFAAIAICNPNRIIRWDEIDGEIHKILADRIEAEEVKVAALKMEGTLFDVQFHVSSNIPKEGIRPPHGPDTEGQRDKVFRIEGPSEWVLNGLYLYSQELQLMASTGGQPIHIHGYEKNSKRGGNIDSARINRLSVHLYPIEDVKFFQNDLWIEDVKRDRREVEIIVVNEGRMNVKYVTVEALFPEREKWAVTVEQIPPMSKKFIKFSLPPDLPDGIGRVVVDPNDDIKERREDNNRFQWPIRAEESTGETY